MVLWETLHVSVLVNGRRHCGLSVCLSKSNEHHISQADGDLGLNKMCSCLGRNFPTDDNCDWVFLNAHLHDIMPYKRVVAGALFMYCKVDCCA